MEHELRNVLKRGGVIAGSSAGATILASYLARGDPKGAEMMMAKGDERGFTEAGQPQYSLTSGSHFDLRKRKPL